MPAFDRVLQRLSYSLESVVLYLLVVVQVVVYKENYPARLLVQKWLCHRLLLYGPEKLALWQC